MGVPCSITAKTATHPDNRCFHCRHACCSCGSSSSRHTQPEAPASWENVEIRTRAAVDEVNAARAALTSPTYHSVMMTSVPCDGSLPLRGVAAALTAPLELDALPNTTAEAHTSSCHREQELANKLPSTFIIHSSEGVGASDIDVGGGILSEALPAVHQTPQESPTMSSTRDSDYSSATHGGFQFEGDSAAPLPSYDCPTNDRTEVGGRRRMQPTQQPADPVSIGNATGSLHAGEYSKETSGAKPRRRATVLCHSRGTTLAAHSYLQGTESGTSSSLSSWSRRGSDVEVSQSHRDECEDARHSLPPQSSIAVPDLAPPTTREGTSKALLAEQNLNLNRNSPMHATTTSDGTSKKGSSTATTTTTSRKSSTSFVLAEDAHHHRSDPLSCSLGGAPIMRSPIVSGTHGSTPMHDFFGASAYVFPCDATSTPLAPSGLGCDPPVLSFSTPHSPLSPQGPFCPDSGHNTLSSLHLRGDRSSQNERTPHPPPSSSAGSASARATAPSWWQRSSTSAAHTDRQEGSGSFPPAPDGIGEELNAIERSGGPHLRPRSSVVSARSSASNGAAVATSHGTFTNRRLQLQVSVSSFSAAGSSGSRPLHFNVTPRSDGLFGDDTPTPRHHHHHFRFGATPSAARQEPMTPFVLDRMEDSVNDSSIKADSLAGSEGTTPSGAVVLSYPDVDAHKKKAPRNSVLGAPAQIHLLSPRDEVSNQQETWTCAPEREDLSRVAYCEHTLTFSAPLVEGGARGDSLSSVASVHLSSSCREEDRCADRSVTLRSCR